MKGWFSFKYNTCKIIETEYYSCYFYRSFIQGVYAEQSHHNHSLIPKHHPTAKVNAHI